MKRETKMKTQDSSGYQMTHGAERKTHPVFIAESLTVTSTKTIAEIALDADDHTPGGGVPTIEGGTIGPFELAGRYCYTVAFTDGSTLTFGVLVCEAACVDKINATGSVYPRNGLTPLDHRLVLQSIANDAAPWFDGHASTLSSRSLTHYGA